MDRRVSIIIPVREINDYIREAMPYLQGLSYNSYEILIIPDHPSKEVFEKTRIIPSGETGPAQKRDMALRWADGEFLAFIDDDAYPDKDWLKNAIPCFENPEVGAVGGPAVTPETDGLWEQASGKALESFLCCGGCTYRYTPGRERETDELPSVNLIVRRSSFEKLGGFDSDYYPGEDTRLCQELIHTLGQRILYTPRALVWHHRRRLFLPHLKQICNYAAYRGFFVRKRQKTSMKLSYAIPSLFVLGLLAGPAVCCVMKPLWYVYGGVLLLYGLLAAWSLRRVRGIRLWLLSFAGVAATNIGYGIFYWKGLLFPGSVKRR